MSDPHLVLPPQRRRRRGRTRRLTGGQQFMVFAFVVLVVGVVFGGLSQLRDERTLNVVFAQDATPGDVQRVRTECGVLPGVSPLPPPRADKPSSRVYPLRFSVAGASGNEVNALTACLQAKPGVNGVQFEGEPGG